MTKASKERLKVNMLRLTFGQINTNTLTPSRVNFLGHFFDVAKQSSNKNAICKALWTKESY